VDFQERDFSATRGSAFPFVWFWALAEGAEPTEKGIHFYIHNENIGLMVRNPFL
jgi:hypothetical protein